MIVLRAKNVDFQVTYINLRDKPDWFLAISPHGKVPVLAVDEQPLFESNAIAEYLDEEVAPPLHPRDAIKRARNRAWTDFVPDFASSLSPIYYAKGEDGAEQRLETARGSLAKLERAISEERGNDGPYFNGSELCLVDAAYAPFFQRFQFADAKMKTGLLDEFPKVSAWAKALLANDRVQGSVADSFETEFIANLHRREAFSARYFPLSDAADE